VNEKKSGTGCCLSRKDISINMKIELHVKPPNVWVSTLINKSKIIISRQSYDYEVSLYKIYSTKKKREKKKKPAKNLDCQLDES
jgi:hypothetical protein